MGQTRSRRSRLRWRTWPALVALSAAAGCAVPQMMPAAGWFVGDRSPAIDPACYERHASVDEAIAVGHGARPSQSLFEAPNINEELSMDDPRVIRFVAHYQTRMRASFQDALERSGQYRTRIIAILEREGVPTDLAYLPLIESGFRTHAVSRAGAVGLWQFVPETGRRYGLRIDAFVDERRDPVRSTRAAARYLRDLHAQFRSWHLSLAAYNVGPGRVARLVARRGVWALARLLEEDSLPLETRNYVSQFFAVVQIAHAPERHGFTRSSQTPARYDVVRVRSSVTFRRLASLAGVPVAEIAELNPALVQRITPPDERGYLVRVPRGTKERFELADAPTTAVVVGAAVPPRPHGLATASSRDRSVVHEAVIVAER
jgi:membrane-bound lytic murein transglycosylase D